MRQAMRTLTPARKKFYARNATSMMATTNQAKRRVMIMETIIVVDSGVMRPATNTVTLMKKCCGKNGTIMVGIMNRVRRKVMIMAITMGRDLGVTIQATSTLIPARKRCCVKSDTIMTLITTQVKLTMNLGLITLTPTRKHTKQ